MGTSKQLELTAWNPSTYVLGFSLQLMKTCNKCLEEKSLEAFSPLSNGVNGTRPSCKACLAKSARLYRALNTDASRAATRRYRETHIETVSAKNRAYYSEHKKESLKRLQEWRMSNPEASNELGRRHSNRRRARRLNNGVEPYTETQVLEKYGALCHLCDKEIDLTAPRRAGVDGWENGLHIEHLIPIVAGGTDSLENVRPSHGLCNLKKGITITE